jgi:hypothetical protein
MGMTRLSSKQCLRRPVRSPISRPASDIEQTIQANRLAHRQIPGSARRIFYGKLPGDNRQRSAAEGAVMFGPGADVDGGVADDAG